MQEHLNKRNEPNLNFTWSTIMKRISLIVLVTIFLANCFLGGDKPVPTSEFN